MIHRFIHTKVEQVLADRKAVVIIGARQVGKTTVLKELAKMYDGTMILDCDEPDVRALLTDATSTSLKNLFGNATVVVIDEAQRVKNIGVTLKLITDKMQDISLIVSGSSALELSSGLGESLTGRKVELEMSGLSIGEMVAHHGALEERRLLENRLLYGMYPEVVCNPGRAEKQLLELSSSYLYKDIFNYQDVRKPELLPNLLEALARQIGKEVSYNELSNLLAIDSLTISRYIDLLEKTMVVFRLRSFSRNLRNELKKSRKIYFYDNGIRNAIIGDFRPLSLRSDVGDLWENFIISERRKHHQFGDRNVKAYFWRTKQQQEIDLIEEHNGQIDAIELKYNANRKVRFSSTFVNEYKPTSSVIIHQDNYIDHLR
jgi:uncharacterized protein